MRRPTHRRVPLITLLLLGAACRETGGDAESEPVVCRAEDVPMLVSLASVEEEPADAFRREAFWSAQPSSGPPVGLELSPYVTKQGLALSTPELGIEYDVDAVTLGLDWIPIRWDHSQTPPKALLAPLSPGMPGGEPGWAALLYTSDGVLKSYGWGSVTFVAPGVDQLKPEAQLAAPGRVVDALDYNGWVREVGDFSTCFEPPGEVPPVVDVLFSTSETSEPGQGAVIWAVTAIQVGTTWRWSPRREVTLHGLDIELGLDPTKADFDALALDREHGVLLYSLDQDDAAAHPFYAVGVDVELDVDGTIQSLNVRETGPLHDENGTPLGTVIGPRPKAGCGIDPRWLRRKGG